MTVQTNSLSRDPNPPLQSGTAPLRGRRRSRALLAGVSLLVLAGAGWFGWHYWTVGRFEVSTDDAYVQADNTTVAPKVAGHLVAVLVGDNQPVTAGQVLARIDDRDFQAALDDARANLQAAEAALANKTAALDTQRSIIDAARATIEADLANQTFAEQDDRRFAALAVNGAGTLQSAQQAASRIAAIRATVAHDRAALAVATKQVEQMKAELGQAAAALAHQQAALHQAELNLSYTAVLAPVAGVVGNRSLRVGQFVQAGTQLMSIVPLEAAYIVANFKETQLTRVGAGQPVAIEVDMFPGVRAHGHIDSLAPASGQEFALLPPDNATGNFTKIVQRIPVKIVLDPDSPLAGALRPGMSVSPTIFTGGAAFGQTAVTAPAHAG